MLACYVRFHVHCDLCDGELNGFPDIAPAILEAVQLGWDVGIEGADGFVTGHIKAFCPACQAETANAERGDQP